MGQGKRARSPRQDVSRKSARGMGSARPSNAMRLKNKLPCIDKKKTAPMLFQLFIKENENNFNVEELENSKIPDHEMLSIYTWLDTTFQQLAYMVKKAYGYKDVTIEFSSVYMEHRAKKLRTRPLSTVNIYTTSTSSPTLAESGYHSGDIIIALITTSTPKLSKQPADILKPEGT
ncbi:uncharacterized protein LOC126316765 [Schistocerca gregaria]|uniref:uncharacterized protein LOC126316765 n=1 Tax=Schistocerca gregaria TaxID=7010 RepID=UPI00211EBAB2|nr:uncharacterized protein LOC126316765 [Schistocerca gregaria]